MNKNGRVPHLAVVGGGIAGLIVATRLGHALARHGRARVSLVDLGPTHVWKPMLHTFAAGTWDVHQQQVPYLTHAHAHHFEYVPGRLTGIDRDNRQLQLEPLCVEGRVVAEARALDYDALVLACGSRANDFNTAGVQEHCHFIDTQAQADAFNANLRAHVAQGFSRGQDIEVAIVGGGATGVELAAELSRMVELAAAYGGESDRRPRLKLTLVESGPRILNAFPEEISASSTAQLHAIGVQVRTGVRVVSADAEGFTLEGGERIRASLRVWAAGIRASTSLGDSGLEVNRAGQLLINQDLRTTQDADIFAIGDCASLLLPGAERPLPSTAQVANQQALHLVRHLPGYLRDASPIPPFTFRDYGSLVSLSDYNAFGTLGRLGLFRGGFIKGQFARISHAFLYRRHQVSIHGPGRAALFWLAERINALVQPRIRIT